MDGKSFDYVDSEMSMKKDGNVQQVKKVQFWNSWVYFDRDQVCDFSKCEN